ncbi:MAG: M60 family metallopeptidase [Bacteroides sp.]|nr:M60 family metallopeptidase [Bacteroides sp.]MCM1378485.1 M60 family metallopeptidase [Bacteroides sp.]MCM1444786.1 M60 family metallopeptidase [Prevotella sp.]
MKSNITKAMLAGLIALSATSVGNAQAAQNDVQAAKLGALVYSKSTIALDDYLPTEIVIPTYSLYKIAVSGSDWVTPTVIGDEIHISVAQNNSAVTRNTTLSLRTSASTSVAAQLTISQPGWQFSETAQATADALFAVPVYAVDAGKSAAGRANSANESIEKTFDGDAGTIYHTQYNGGNNGFSSNPDQWPILEYYFAEENAEPSAGVDIEQITYVPRQEGGSNGNFGQVTIEIGKMNADRTYTWTNVTGTPDKRLDFGMKSNSSTVEIPESMQTGVRAVRFTVHTGFVTDSSRVENYASCAEMKFKKKAVADPNLDVFVDGICSALKPGVTAAQIEALTNPFYKQLAEIMFKGEYDSSKMVSTHEAVMSPQTLAESWNAPGKCYDQSQGVTGVALTPGKYVVMVEGIPAAKGSVGMVVIRWHGHNQYKDENDNTQSWYAERFNFTLFNGINVIELPTPKRDEEKIVAGHDMGLAYINNFDDEVTSPEIGAERAVKVHIVGGLYNGYLSNLKSSAENDLILKHAVYPCIDLLGQRVHSVWQTNALQQYTSGQIVKYINLLDLLIIWEHRVLGLEKYNKIPDNRTMTYVNYNYYMYQGGWGPTFMYDTQGRVCNVDNLMNRDSDAVWGLSHEWGHQHQMAPYFRWIGTAEVSNNIFSAYNVLHMGYDVASGGRYPYDKWHRKGNTPGKMEKIFLNDDYNREITAPDAKGETKTANTNDNLVMSCRTDAAKAAKAGRAFTWCKELQDFAINQVKYPTKRFTSDGVYSGAPTDTWNPANTEDPRNIVDPRRALNPIEAYSSNNGELVLAPFINLMFYFSEKLGGCTDEQARPDLYADLFESLRQNDYAEGSSVEPGKTTADKYEILTSIFNGNKSADKSINKVTQFKERFPESCWTKKGYIGTETSNISWTQNSGPAIMNCIMKLSRLTGYNLWSYFERYGMFTVCAIEQGDYGTQYYIMTDDMYDEFKADLDDLEKQGVLKPLTEEMRNRISIIDCPIFAQPNIPNDGPIDPKTL